MADDLEPNFMLDKNVALASDDDEDGGTTALPTKPHRSLEDEDDFALEGEWNGLSAQPSLSQDTEDPKATKKRKKKERQKENKAKKRRLQEEQKEPLPSSGKVEDLSRGSTGPSSNNDHSNPANQRPADLAEYLVKMQHKTFGSGISDLELADMSIPESSIVDTSQYTKPHTKDTLPEFIRQVVPSLYARLKDKPKINGAPVALVVSGAALRVADLVRSCRPLKGPRGGEIAKLFAKHMKVSEQVEYLQQTPISVAIGTPDRLGKLLSAEDGLKSTNLEYIVLDSTHKDAKNRTLLDIPETRKEVFASVFGHGPTGSSGGKAVMKLVKTGKIKLIVY
ncbi:hypothetical protein FRB90_005298 [Tulasnella sp. 427]|nr:hypothetical protein FRB90_005298 [Tulasnella sp. 427]